MYAELTAAEIAQYTADQLNAFFPAPRPVRAADLDAAVTETLALVERCFASILLPAYRHGEQPRFDVYHSDQYCTYLAYLGNVLWRAEADRTLLGRVFGLNKALNGVSCMYDNPLPEVILLVHAIGSVIGKAVLPNYLVVTQGVTIGAIGGTYPLLSPGLILSAGSSVIGPCSVGRNVMLEPHVHVLKTDIPNDVRVSGERPHRFVAQSDRALRHYFRMADD